MSLLYFIHHRIQPHDNNAFLQCLVFDTLFPIGNRLLFDKQKLVSHLHVVRETVFRGLNRFLFPQSLFAIPRRFFQQEAFSLFRITNPWKDVRRAPWYSLPMSMSVVYHWWDCFKVGDLFFEMIVDLMWDKLVIEFMNNKLLLL